MLASVSYRADQVDVYLQRTAATGWIYDEVEWARSEESARLAVGLDPANARLYAQLGELYAWKGQGQRLWPNLARSAYEVSVDYWFSALARSPADGRIWARAASITDQSDSPRSIALASRALELAPFEPDAQFGYSLVLVRHWDELEPTTRARFTDVVAIMTANANSLEPFRQGARRVGREREWGALKEAAQIGAGVTR